MQNGGLIKYISIRTGSFKKGPVFFLTAWLEWYNISVYVIT